MAVNCRPVPYRLACGVDVTSLVKIFDLMRLELRTMSPSSVPMGLVSLAGSVEATPVCRPLYTGPINSHPRAIRSYRLTCRLRLIPVGISIGLV